MLIIQLFSELIWTNGAQRSLSDQAQVKKALLKPPSQCILGIYVKPTWRHPLLERCVRSAGVYWSLQSHGGPSFSHIQWETLVPMDSEGHTVPAGLLYGPNCFPVCGEEGERSWDVLFYSAEVWDYIKLLNSVSISTWPKRSPRWAFAIPFH